MDIRIGNDIRLNIAISDFDKFDDETIKCAHFFLMSESEKNLINVDPKPTVLSTKYTLHHSNARIYNVLPINAQVRPCDGPGFFGKTLRQYGKQIFTSVSEDDGYIYGFFKGREQLVLGDYYLVVMVSFHREGFGERTERTVVANYGYVFTLTMDGAPAPKEGIGDFVQVKPKNEITLSIPASAVRDSEVTLSGTAKYGGTVTFTAVDANGDAVVITDDKFTITSNTTITATSTSGEGYDSDTVTRVITCTEPPKYAYYGSSIGVPVTVSTTHSIVLPGVVQVTTEQTDAKNCHWIAYPAGFSCSNIVDKDNDAVDPELIHDTTIDGYTVKYFLDPDYNIINTTKFTISKVS